MLDLQFTVADLSTADRIAPQLAAAGFPSWPWSSPTTPNPRTRTRRTGRKRLHGNADPGRTVNLHVRTVGSPGWRFALCFRDWLRDDAAARADYLAEKRRVAKLHGVDKSTAGYAADKEGWFADYAAPRMDVVGPAHRLAPAVVRRRRNPETPPRTRPEADTDRAGSGTAQS